MPLCCIGVYRHKKTVQAKLYYFFCFFGDRTSTAVAGDEASQNTGLGFWIDAASNLKRFYSFFCGQYLSCHCYFSSLGVAYQIFCFIVGRKSAGSLGDH